MYYKQLPCIYHPELNITNFCQDQQCLMPLCPSCIRQHTQFHEKQKTKPQYFNIYQALAQTDTLITNSICNLEKDKKRNSELIYTVNRLPTIIHEKVQQARTMALKILQQTFLQLERDTLQTIRRINQQQNLHSQRKSQTYEQSLVTNLQDLYDLADGLKTDSCLSDMIFFLKQKRFEVDDLHSEMSHYLYANQSYEPFIEINKQAQQSLSIVIQRMFKLDPKQKNVTNQNRNVPRVQGKSLYENSYHINLTPSRLNKSLYSFDKGLSYNPSTRHNQSSTIPSNIKHNNSTYQNYNQYHQHLQKSRNTSRQVRQTSTERPGQNDSQFRQINIKQKQRKVYYQQPDQLNQKQRFNNSLTRRENATKYTKY